MNNIDKFKRKMEREDIPEREQNILMNIYRDLNYRKIRGNNND